MHRGRDPAGQGGAGGGEAPGRPVHLRQRRAGGVHSHRDLPLLHDVPDHGEDRLRRGRSRPARAASRSG
ncbi:MAG: hypothetical protein M0C28_00265 [Candidatus Moduliflexus flocculans]|nr:hypothetical protein [Candidatus Moduliflexus flocculans]